MNENLNCSLSKASVSLFLLTLSVCIHHISFHPVVCPLPDRPLLSLLFFVQLIYHLLLPLLCSHPTSHLFLFPPPHTPSFSFSSPFLLSLVPLFIFLLCHPLGSSSSSSSSLFTPVLPSASPPLFPPPSTHRHTQTHTHTHTHTLPLSLSLLLLSSPSALSCRRADVLLLI